MNRLCDRIHDFAQGELEEAAATEVADHLPLCSTCQDELLELMQLSAIEDQLLAETGELQGQPRTTAAAGGEIIELDVHRAQAAGLRVGPAVPCAQADSPAPIQTKTASASGDRKLQRWGLTAVVGALAVAAGFLIIGRNASSSSDEQPTGPAMAQLLGDTEARRFEGRVSYQSLAAHRPYDVQRADDDTPAKISMQALAALEKAGDHHGLGIAHLLLGQEQAAARYLQQVKDKSAVAARSDRALVLLEQKQPRKALLAIDALLAEQPTHRPALWNRALALRELGLPLAAAEAFERIVALEEAGWSQEARVRASGLRSSTEERGKAYKETYAKGMAWIGGGAPLSVAELRRFPGIGRLLFYDLLRTATTREDALELLPHAEALDGLDGGSSLADYARAVAQADFKLRAPLAQTYQRIVVGASGPEDSAAAYLEALRRAGASDILQGALLHLSPTRPVVAAAHLEEYTTLAEASDDLWMSLLAIENRAEIRHNAGDYAGAEATLLSGIRFCKQGAPDYRCSRLHRRLATVYLDQHRTTAATKQVTRALVLARRGQDWWSEGTAIATVGEIAHIHEDDAAQSHPLATAFFREVLLRDPDNCAYISYARESTAMILINRRELEGARTELLALAEACPANSVDLNGAFIRAHLLADSRDAAAIRKLQSRIHELRSDLTADAVEHIQADHAEGRLLLSTQPANARALLESAIRRADRPGTDDAHARRGRGYSYALLAVNAAKQRDYSTSIALLAQEVGIAAAADPQAPPPCTVGVAVDDAVAVVAVGDDGKAHGRYLEPPPGYRTIDTSALLTTELLRVLERCEVVDVLARAPVQGATDLLPPRIAWRYRVGGDARAISSDGVTRRVVVADTEPPAELGLRRLSRWQGPPADVILRGSAATPTRVLAEIADASEIELHTHGLVNLGISAASFLALSPEQGDRFALTAADISGVKFSRSPVVVLAACQAATGASFFHASWSLPTSFIDAGARSVLASANPIPDAGATAFFAAVQQRIRSGQPPAMALRDERMKFSKDKNSGWVTHILLFE